MTHSDLISHYRLDKQMLHVLYDRIVDFLGEKGVNVTYKNLEPVIESDVYGMTDAIKPADKHHESCLSDGREIYLHDNMEDIGGICSRLYDILHMGCGHVWQWSAQTESNLKFYGEHAWSIGSTYYLGASEDKLKEVWDYEEEAGALALANLELVLKKYDFNKDFAENIVGFFNDYLKTDLDYITSFYRTKKVANFFDGWQFNARPLRVISPDFKLYIQRRTNNCIALINVR